MSIHYGKYKAHPTKYRGRQYRSRLEARWACFFDLMKWPVEYEPFDLNGWVPDFVLRGAREVLVEVKPIDVFHGDTAQRMHNAAPDQELLLLGHSWPPGDRNHENVTCIGWFWEAADPSAYNPKDWQHALCADQGGGAGLTVEYGHYVDRIYGGHVQSPMPTTPIELALSNWTLAANMTQYRKPHAR